MKRILATLLCLLPLSASAYWQSRSQVGVGSAPTYTGPIDVVASPTFCYSLRACSGALAATGTTKSVNIRRASDNSTQDIVILTSGDIDIAGYNTFVGTDATASCTISGTSMACTGASATLHVNDLVTGVGITNSCLVTATNGSTTATVSLAGTSTSCGTVSVAETVTFQVAGFPPTWYDQTTNAKNAAQATAGSQPQFLPLGGPTSTKPAIEFSNGPFMTQVTYTLTQPFTFSAVTIGLNAANNQELLRSVDPTFLRYAGNTTVQMFAGAGPLATVSTVWHAFQVLFSGASSTINVDGTDNNNGTPGTNGVTGTPCIGCTPGGTEPFNGQMSEFLAYPVGFTSGNRASMHTNQAAYWGTP